MLQHRKIYCLEARPCTLQPGNFSGWGSEGVKQATLMNVLLHVGFAENSHVVSSCGWCLAAPENKVAHG